MSSGSLVAIPIAVLTILMKDALTIIPGFRFVNLSTMTWQGSAREPGSFQGFILPRPFLSTSYRCLQSFHVRPCAPYEVKRPVSHHSFLENHQVACKVVLSLLLRIFVASDSGWNNSIRVLSVSMMKEMGFGNRRLGDRQVGRHGTLGRCKSNSKQ